MHHRALQLCGIYNLLWSHSRAQFGMCNSGSYVLLRWTIQRTDSFTIALTLRTFFRHRKEMNEYLSSHGDITRNKYHPTHDYCLPGHTLQSASHHHHIVTSILEGNESSLNYPYISWEKCPQWRRWTSSWIITQHHSTNSGQRMDQWVESIRSEVGRMDLCPPCRHFLQRLRYDSRNATTYRAAFWFIPERCGYKDDVFLNWRQFRMSCSHSDPVLQVETRPAANR